LNNIPKPQKRLEVEAKYHDRLFAEQNSDMVYNLPIPPIAMEHLKTLLGCLEGKTVVEIGCGIGEELITLASKGADVWGIDISRKAIERCCQRISDTPFASRIHLEVSDVHNLHFPDSFADIIFGNAILHHLDLEVVRDEIHRCLKPGGKAVFAEPLGHNVFINFFRKLTPGRRTPTENPLRWSDIEMLSQKFRVSHREFFCLPLVAFVPGLLGMPRLFRWSFNILYRVEHGLRLDHVFRKYCWITVLEMYKEDRNK
jgi:SAM-dependent methyltransferase